MLQKAGKLDTAKNVLQSGVNLAEKISIQHGMVTIRHSINELVQVQQTVQAAQVSSVTQASIKASRWGARAQSTLFSTSMANRRKKIKQKARITHDLQTGSLSPSPENSNTSEPDQPIVALPEVIQQENHTLSRQKLIYLLSILLLVSLSMLLLKQPDYTVSDNERLNVPRMN